METIKSYTDLEQSKKLAEILPLESADYCWGIDEKTLRYNNSPYPCPWKDYTAKQYYAPCWSLAALLSIIPNYKLSSEHNYHTCTAELFFGKERVAWFFNPVDACVEQIMRLHELKIL